MKILVVGNVTKDVYLNLDPRAESFETDRQNVDWLNIAFNTSEHRFFNRASSLGGAAISLEVLSKLGLDATVAGTDISLSTDGFTATSPIQTYRYILVANSGISYLVPTHYQPTSFAEPHEDYDYLYLDRSAEITADAAAKLHQYLNSTPRTRLILYARHLDNPHLNSLLSRASLIFLEHHPKNSAISHAPLLNQLDQNKIVHLSENHLSYLNLNEPIAIERINLFTHLSAYSITSATILGCFILGYSVKKSLKLARANIEHSKLNATLSLDQLQELAYTSESASGNTSDNLELIASSLVINPKGILAADESGGSIHKKFATLNIPDTYENRRDYRNIFFTTPELERYVSGIILFDETARQLADNGQNFTDFITARRIIPGIKVDQGLAPLSEIDPIVSPDSGETYTKGLNDLSSRLQEYYQMGLRFAKWRAAFELKFDDAGHRLTPTDTAIRKNCQILAEYAKTCQKAGIVPIVEPELVYDGDYDINQSAEVTSEILDALFQELHNARINLRACILKCNMVLAGKQHSSESTPDEVGTKTASVLKYHVPKDLAGVVFLSGGQTPEQATANLAAVIKHGPFPWSVTFSFARALQDPALYAWAGDNANADAARTAFYERLVANSKALTPDTNHHHLSA